MRESSINESKSKPILRSQRHWIVGYISAFALLAAAIMFMPTEVLIWNLGSGSIYGHSILFWFSLFSGIFCFSRFKKENTYFKKHFSTKLPKKIFSLCRSSESKFLLVITAAMFLLFLIMFCFPIAALPRFILFGISIFLLGLYLGLNSYEYRIYRKHSTLTYRIPQKSQIRRDENDEHHQS